LKSVELVQYPEMFSVKLIGMDGLDMYQNMLPGDVDALSLMGSNK